MDIFSLSFGACELDLTTADNKLINGWWQQAATQGIAVTVSTGDDGSAACDNNNTRMTATGGLLVSGFASTPYNIAVGGTDFGPAVEQFRDLRESEQQQQCRQVLSKRDRNTFPSGRGTTPLRSTPPSAPTFP